MVKSQSLVYIDGANVWFTQKSLGWKLDWKKVLGFLNNEFKISSVIYYNAVKGGDTKTTEYLSGLEKLGIKVKSKELKAIHTDKGIIYKGNFDVEMAADIIMDATNSDIKNIVLFSGDSDFAYLADLLHQKFNKKVFVFSSNKFLSWELRKKADRVYILNKLTNLAKDVKNI